MVHESHPPRSLISFTPIGIARTPFHDKASAPRQATTAEARNVAGSIELFAGQGYEDALANLGEWTHLWVVFVFHQAIGWRPKVQPPRSESRKGLFATRTPHRPNPIGFSAVALERIEGLSVHVRGIDLVDGTPILDLKPYVSYADAIPAAGAGWLAADAGPRYAVIWTPRATDQAAFVAASLPAFRESVEALLATGPQPHAYRRIRKEGEGFRLAYKEWRVHFVIERYAAPVASVASVARRGDGRDTGGRLIVTHVASGFTPKELAVGTDARLGLHRSFVASFPAIGPPPRDSWGRPSAPRGLPPLPALNAATSLQDAYDQAIRFAAHAHGEQKVPGGPMPYVVHLSLVAMEVLSALAVEAAQSPVLAIQCALLHDTVEDTGTKLEEVRAVFGDAVADGVSALTKRRALPKEEQMEDSLGRIERQPREVSMVKLADRVTNMGPPPAHWTAEKRASYKREAETVLARLGDASPFLTDRLRARIAAYPAI